MLCEPNQNAVRVLHRYAFPSVEICTDRVFHLWGPQHTVPLAIISMKKPRRLLQPHVIKGLVTLTLFNSIFPSSCPQTVF